ncbi:Hypothetical protein BFF96_0554 [Corynebacterium pseudotuberculosis]|nr:Hypothetical protein BFF96_0554 [Corynebacterium pseudotuberculosis]
MRKRNPTPMLLGLGRPGYNLSGVLLFIPERWDLVDAYP